MISEFKNEALTNFSQKENQDQMVAAIEKVRSQLGQTYPLIIDGKEG